MDRLSGKVAFVTGAAQGIGCSIAETFAREGARVLAADVQRIGSALLSMRRVTAIELDVTNEAAIRKLAGEHCDVSVLVNCVGIVPSGTILQSAAGTVTTAFQINVLSMFSTISAFLPSMLAAGHGSIVNIASVVSSTKGAVNRFAYGVTKAAVIGLTKSVARDYVDQGIRCNCISPGTIMTPSLQQRIARQGGDSALATFIDRQPMGRLGRSDEIAEVALLLASDEAGFMTGSDIVIDGGMSL